MNLPRGYSFFDRQLADEAGEDILALGLVLYGVLFVGVHVLVLQVVHLQSDALAAHLAEVKQQVAQVHRAVAEDEHKVYPGGVIKLNAELVVYADVVAYLHVGRMPVVFTYNFLDFGVVVLVEVQALDAQFLQLLLPGNRLILILK